MDPSVHPELGWPGRPLRRAGDRWLDRWLRSCAELARLQYSHPMVDAVIEEVDGRMIRVGHQWLVDFGSSSYLGLDLDQEVIRAVPAYLEAWGTHVGRPRMLGSPVLYEQIEVALSSLVGTEDALVFPSVTHIHTSVIPVLAGNGAVFMDARAHKTIYDGCDVARGHGATVQRFRHRDPEDLERLLRTSRSSPRVICMDGVNSMTGNVPDVREFAEIARRYGALLYVDDAQGFGILGERSSMELCAYGTKGNGLVRHAGETYDNIVMVAGLSKAYSSLTAFVACPSRLKEILKTAAPPYLYSGPSPVASLATTLEGLKVNERRGDLLRLIVYRKTQRLLAALHELGIANSNTSGHPIVGVSLARSGDLKDVGMEFLGRGVYLTLAAHPLVPQGESGFRIQLTAAHSDEQIEHLVEVLGELAGAFRATEQRQPLRLLKRA